MDKPPEIEVRSFPDEDQRAAILGELSSLPGYTEYNRVMVEFSGVDRDYTAKLRINNGVVEIVAKTGSLTAKTRTDANVIAGVPHDEAIEEATNFLEITGKSGQATPEMVVAASGSFTEALGFMALLGYTNAKVCLRVVHEATDEGIEVSLRDVISGVTNERTSSLLEVEAKNPAWSEDEAFAQARGLLAHNGLREATDEEWTTWVQRTHEIDDIDFTYSKAAAKELASQLTKTGLL